MGRGIYKARGVAQTLYFDADHWLDADMFDFDFECEVRSFLRVIMPDSWTRDHGLRLIEPDLYHSERIRSLLTSPSSRYVVGVPYDAMDGGCGYAPLVIGCRELHYTEVHQSEFHRCNVERIAAKAGQLLSRLQGKEIVRTSAWTFGVNKLDG